MTAYIFHGIIALPQHHLQFEESSFHHFYPVYTGYKKEFKFYPSTTALCLYDNLLVVLGFFNIYLTQTKPQMNAYSK